MKPNDHSSLTRRTIGGMLWLAWGKGAHAILQTLILAVLARLLTPADFGVVSAALVVIGFSAIVSHLGLGPALVQRPKLEPRHIEAAFTASVLLGVLLGGTVWLIAPSAASFFRIDGVEPVLRLLSWVFPLQGFGIAAESLLRRELRFRRLANIDVVSFAVGYGAVGITLAMGGWGVWALATAHLSQTLLKTVILLVSEPPRVRRLGERRAFLELMYFGGGFTMAKIANYIALQGDNLVVGRFLGPAALGFYGRAYQLMTAPAHGIGAIMDNVLFPAMAKVQHDPARLAAAYRRGVALIALVVLPPSAAIILVAPELVHVIMGPRWGEMVVPFQILSIGMLFRTSYKMSDSIARSTGAVYRRAWRQVLYALLVVGGALAGQRWGLVGVSWGVLGAVAANFLIMAQLSLDVARMTWSSFWRAHLPAVRITALLLPVTWMVVTLLREVGLAPWAVTVATGALVLAGALLLVRLYPRVFLGRDGLWMLDSLRSFLPAMTLRRASPAAAPAYEASGAREIP